MCYAQWSKMYKSATSKKEEDEENDDEQELDIENGYKIPFLTIPEFKGLLKSRIRQNPNL